MRLGMMAPEPSLSPVPPCHRIQIWQTENSWRVDRSYRGCRRRVIPCMVDAARFRSLIDEFPSPSRTLCSQSPEFSFSWPSEVGRRGFYTRGSALHSIRETSKHVLSWR